MNKNMQPENIAEKSTVRISAAFSNLLPDKRKGKKKMNEIFLLIF